MGQTTNSNILKLGLTMEWESKYIEKKSNEFSTLLIRELEIRQFIIQFFIKYQCQISSCKIYYSENFLNVFISYYSLIYLYFFNSKAITKFTNQKSKRFQNAVTLIDRTTAKKRFYILKVYIRTLKQILTERFLKKKTQRLIIIQNCTLYKGKKSYRTIKQYNANWFVSKVLKILTLFTTNKYNIIINIKQINKESCFFWIIFKTNKNKFCEKLVQLWKFQQNEFFKKGFNLLYNFVLNQQKPLFLIKTITFYLKTLKRPNFFFRFLKLALKVLLSEKHVLLERVQIQIKGRFNGTARSNYKTIYIGKNIPIITLNANTNYSKSTAYTINGTFGVKVWVYFKNYAICNKIF